MARDEFGPILNGIPSRIPDIDPEQTQEWLDSLDAVVDDRVQGVQPLLGLFRVDVRDPTGDAVQDGSELVACHHSVSFLVTRVSQASAVVGGSLRVLT